VLAERTPIFRQPLILRNLIRSYHKINTKAHEFRCTFLKSVLSLVGFTRACPS
jgi:hypothetical protein